MAQRRVNRRDPVDVADDEREPSGRGEQEMPDSDDPRAEAEDELEVLDEDVADVEEEQDVFDEEENADADSEDEPGPSRRDEGRTRRDEHPVRRGARPARGGERTVRGGERPVRGSEGPAGAGTRSAREGAPPARGGNSSLTIREAASAALREIAELTAKQVESIVGVERTQDGWLIDIDVVEDRRIPSTTDLLATYQAALDSDGELVSYRRVRRYTRGRGDSEDS